MTSVVMRRRPSFTRCRVVREVMVSLILLSLLLASVQPVAAKQENFYKVLGVSRRATKPEIKKAFRKLTMENHPDLKETAEEKEAAKAKMLVILQAYEVLGDETQRALYDASGAVTRPIPDPSQFATTEEVFEFFHQSAPLVSKARKLESENEMKRIFNFRGEKIFFIHVYADSNKECRLFAPSWEELYHSPLVSSGAVVMYRIDAHSSEGSKLLKTLGISLRSNSPPPVFAVVDGERWSFTPSKDAGSHRTAQQMEDFLLQFFFEVYGDAQEEIRTQEELLNVLTEPLAPHTQARLLMHRLSSEIVQTTLKIRYPTLEIRLVNRKTLLDFAEVYCGQKVVAVNRFGEQMEMPEFAVGVKGPLVEEVVKKQNTKATSKSATAGKSKSSSSSKKKVPVATKTTTDEPSSASERRFSCGNVHIGVSAYLSYPKAEAFVESDLLAPTHAHLHPLRHIDTFQFAEVCREDCLLYILPTCVSSTDGSGLSSSEYAAAMHLMQRQYTAVKTGYLCLDENPRLQSALSATGSANVPLNVSSPFIAAMIDADDAHVYPFFTEQGSQDPSSLTTSSLDATLAKLIMRKLEDDNAELLPSLTIPGGISSLLETRGFPMSSSQRYAVMSSRLYNTVKPYFSTTLPFLVMYLVHRFILNRDKAPVKPVNKTGKRMGAIFDEDDLDDAVEGKGFLILVVDNRPAASGPLTLPSVASDKRFTIRVLSSEHRRWKKWMEKQLTAQKKAAGEQDPVDDTASESSAGVKESGSGSGLDVLAIRKGRMTGAVKPRERDVESFLRDLLDGTISTDISVPYTALR